MQIDCDIVERSSPQRLAPLRELPVVRTTFVDRDEEFVRLATLLEAEGALVTVSGPPGIGKSRLALEVARRRAAGGEPVAFVDLSSAATRRDVSCGFAMALASPPSQPDDFGEALRQVGRSLARHGGPLVLVDGCEHLLAEASASIDALRALAPRARFLVTSREPTGCGGEVVMPLGPLPVPGPGAEGEAIARSAAVALFIERARRRRAELELGSGEDAAIAAIVRALDGNPLAIELCAARTGVLGTREILRHLDRRLALLSAARPVAGSRWSSLEAAIRWSWSLLEARERAVLAQAAVFKGGFTHEAARRVIELDGEDADGAALLDALEALRDKSLLSVSDCVHLEGERRYTLTESIAEFALARLEESGAAERCYGAHERFYLGWLGPSPQARHIAGDEALRARLEAERLNLLAIHDRCMAASPPRGERALMALVALAPLRCTRGPFAEYLADLDAAERAATRAGRMGPEARAASLLGRAAIESRRGGFERAVECYSDALPILRQLEARWIETYVLVVLAGLLPFVYREREVPALLEKARARVAEVGDDRLTAIMYKEVASTLMWRSPEQADAFLERALLLFRLTRDNVRVAYTLALLCACRFACGALDEAERYGEEALRRLDGLEDRRFGFLTRAVLALVDQEQGQLDRARGALEQVLEVQRSLGNWWLATLTCLALADLRLEAGQPDEACRGYLEVLETARPLDERLMSAWALAGLGSATAALGRIDNAEAHLDAGAELAARLSDPALSRGIEARRGHVELARARAAAAEGDDEAAARWIGAARRRLEAPATDERTRVIERRALARLPLRALRAAIEAEAGRLESGLRVDAESRWFALGLGERVSLESRPRPRLVLKRLVQERARRPGSGVSLDELFEAGWPGEKARAESAANRVYVTLTRLRKLGLGDVLVCRPDGFLLDPSVPLVVEGATPPPARMTP